MSRQAIINSDPEQKKIFERIKTQLQTSQQAMLTRYGPSIRLDLMRPHLQRELGTRLISVSIEFLDKKLRKEEPSRCIALGYGKKTAGWITANHPDRNLVKTYLNGFCIPLTYGWEQREVGVGGNTVQRIIDDSGIAPYQQRLADSGQRKKTRNRRNLK